MAYGLLAIVCNAYMLSSLGVALLHIELTTHPLNRVSVLRRLHKTELLSESRIELPLQVP